MIFYLDTSALVKLYHKEAGTQNLVELFHQSAGDLIVTIADIAIIEFHSALLKRVRTREIELDKVEKTFELFGNDVEMFNVIAVDDFVKNFAIQILDSIGHERSLKTLDALQLATAMAVTRVINIDYFIACDKGLLKIAGHYFTTLNPEVDSI